MWEPTSYRRLLIIIAIIISLHMKFFFIAYDKYHKFGKSLSLCMLNCLSYEHVNLRYISFSYLPHVNHILKNNNRKSYYTSDSPNLLLTTVKLSARSSTFGQSFRLRRCLKNWHHDN